LDTLYLIESINLIVAANRFAKEFPP